MRNRLKINVLFFAILSVVSFISCTDNSYMGNYSAESVEVTTRLSVDTTQYFTVSPYLYGDNVTYYPTTIPSDNRAVVRIQFNRTNLRYPGDHAGIIEGRTFTFKYFPVGTQTGLLTFTAKVSAKGTDANLVDVDSKINYALVEVYLPNAFECPEIVTGPSMWPVYVYDEMGRFIGDENNLPCLNFDGRR